MGLFLKFISHRVHSAAVLIVAASLVIAFSSAQAQAQGRNTELKGSPAIGKSVRPKPIAPGTLPPRRPSIEGALAEPARSFFDPMADGAAETIHRLEEVPHHEGRWDQIHEADYASGERPAIIPAVDYSPAASSGKPAKPNPVVKFISTDMAPITRSLVSAEPGSVIKSGIKMAHLLGIILGLGGATILDLVVIRFLLSGEIKAEQITIVRFVTGIVSIGLGILWASGALYLAHYAAFEPVKLWNQKVWAKIAIVGVLTINGYFIHHVVMPLIEKQVGRSLFAGLSHRQVATMLIFGTISATSWYVPLVLGAMPHFNFIVPAPGLLVTYAILLAIAICATQGIVRTIQRGGASPQALA